MYGLVSLLETEYAELIRALQAELASECNLTNAQTVLQPHFTWHVAEGYDQESLKTILQELAQEIAPFKVHTTGIGIFTGEKPVLYLPVVREKDLSCLHQIVWDSVNVTAFGMNLHYAPQTWMPHITLVMDGLDLAKIGCLIQKLVSREFELELYIDNFLFAGVTDDRVLNPIYKFLLVGNEC